MDISVYFEPLDVQSFSNEKELEFRKFSNTIDTYFKKNEFPALENANLAIIGVGEERGSKNNLGCAEGPNEVRKYLYELYQVSPTIKIVDLGNVINGNTIDDTYFAVKSIISELLDRKIIPIVLGGSQDITYANYLAYQSQGKIINIVSVDNRFDLGNAESELNADSFISKIILSQPNYLFNYTNIGYQNHYTDYDAIRLMKKLFFDAYRLGQVQTNIEETEPMVRNADMLSFDISSVRFSDAPGNNNVGPNGLYGEQACQIARYAGMSDKLSSIGFYELNPSLDNRGQTAQLIAQLVWYFIEGYSNRKDDIPNESKSEYTKFIVTQSEVQRDITFYKSKQTSRWWMKVPCLNQEETKYERHFVIPCSYDDYQTAMKNEMPDRLWQVYQKIL